MKLISINSKDYRNIHDWIRRRMKHITACEKCGDKESILDNALITGKYHEKKVENYIKLCRKCHYNYDHPEGYKHTKESKNKIGLESKKRILNNGVSEKFINARKGTFITDKHKELISNAMAGEKHHQSKLTEKDVLYVLNSKESPTKLAKEFNVTYRTIANIKSRKTWKHLD